MIVSAPKAQQMTKMIVRFIARVMHPYNIAEEPGFVDMMQFTMPDYAVPSRTTFSRAIIPDLYASSKDNLKKKLGDIFASAVGLLSITTDGSTSQANDNYVCVTCHVMDSDFVQHVHALACTEITLSHCSKPGAIYRRCHRGVGTSSPRYCAGLRRYR
ncbi:hypothetical protein HPB49_026140 [Dermacentor silvarum]|nr:hypothetical protein HPB49_026140 [Dermacentor silvarum]